MSSAAKSCSFLAHAVASVTMILDEIQAQHAELALKIQSVFDEQSETATESVSADLRKVVADVVSDEADQDSLMKRVPETFMHGMKSMGTFQRINVTKQTEASTNAIRDRINKSIEDVFRGIETMEDQVTALPLQASPKPSKTPRRPWHEPPKLT